MDDWIIRYDGFDPATEGLREALCALGNGYLGTRAAFPECPADGVHYPGTYAAGCYNRLSSDVGGRAVENESVVNLPNWLPLTFAVGDGPWLGSPQVQLLEHDLELDLRRGVLTRWARVRDDRGHTTRLVQRRLAHMEVPHLLALETTIVPEGWSGVLRIRSGLDGTVENTGVARYRDLGSRHLTPVDARSVGDETVLLVVETMQSHLRVAEAARTRLCRDGHWLPVDRHTTVRPGVVEQELTVEVTDGAAVVVDKVVALVTSHDRAISEPAVAALSWLARAGDFTELLGGHEGAWRALWQQARFELLQEDSTRSTVRLHLFHLLQSVSPHAIDLDVGVPPRGLHGEAYRGHIFWDELFVLPILNLRLPTVTRAMLRYRHRRLPAARSAATDAGLRGAMFPWQSGSDGREESQLLHLNPRSGRWLPDATWRQRHIGLAIAYNVWQYYEATGDVQFLSDYGAELILEIARFFATLATHDPGRARYVIRGVVGPDEFHTGYPDRPDVGIDNNAYTNVLTAWVLMRAAETLAVVPRRRRDALTRQLALTDDELTRWDDITRRIYVPFHGDGLISQFEGYDRLDELDWGHYRETYGDIQRLDRILESEGDDVNRYQASKQADVLMLFYLLAAEELHPLLRRLGYDWEPERIPATVDYYLARTSHGSTLSAVVHSWVLTRGHRPRALEFFVRALDSDVADIQGGTTAEGIHLAAMAGSVDLLQRCFAGVRPHADMLHLDPLWPAELGTLEFELLYRGHPLVLRVGEREVEVRAGQGTAPPIQLACGGQVRSLRPGQSVTFSAP